MKRAGAACEAIASWCKAIFKYAETNENLHPRRIDLSEAERTLEGLNSDLLILKDMRDQKGEKC